MASILAVLDANRADTSLFQQPEHQVRKTLGDFLITVTDDGRIAGCAALHWHADDNAEVLAVAVAPDCQGQGIGSALMKACISEAGKACSSPMVWLATAKPSYFARFGFSPISRFRLPIAVLWTKFLLVFQQPPARWLPALFGRHTFMVRTALE